MARSKLEDVADSIKARTNDDTHVKDDGGKGHDCTGPVCTPMYGDPKMDCVPKYIVEPDCSIFAHLPVGSMGRTLSDEASVNGK